MLLAIVWTGCEGTVPSEPVTPPTPPSEEDSGTTSPSEETDPSAPPTDVDAACWSWAAAFMTLTIGEGPDDLIYTRLRTYDPGTLALLSMTFDSDADGNADDVTTYIWDEVFEHILQQWDDNDADGSNDMLTEWAYDTDGNRTALRVDDDNDGAWDEVWTYTYAAGLRLTDEQDLADDGTVDAVGTYSYDDADRIASYEFDIGVDGTIDTLLTYSYLDAPEPSVTRITDDGADGMAEETLTWVYDDQDRLVRTVYSNSEGSEVIYDYTYNDAGDFATYSGVIAHPNSYSRWLTTYTYEGPQRPSRENTEFFTDEDATDPTFLSHVDYSWLCPT